MGMFTERSFGIPRIWSNRVLRQLGACFQGEIINVSGWDDRDKEGNRYRDYFPFATGYYISNFSGIRGLDEAEGITDFAVDLEKRLPDELVGRFDVVFNHTTLEHIFDVTTAFQNLCAMSCDVVIIVVPFAQEMHFTASYGDYWRFTPMTLRRLFALNGFSAIFEIVNDDLNAGIYLLSVGSKYPERWRAKLPVYSEINAVGEWIGWNPLRKIYNGYVKLKRMASKT